MLLLFAEHCPTREATLKSKIIYELVKRENHHISRQILMDKMMMHYTTVSEFDELMHEFEKSGLVRLNIIGRQVVYEMPAHIVEKWKEYFAGNMKKGVS